MVDKVVTFTFVGKDGVTRTLEQVTSSSEKAAGAMEGHASRIGNAFRGLDNQLGQFGIPFTGALSQIGSKLDEMGGKGQSAFQKLSQAGGIALGAVAVVGAGIAAESIHLADSFDTQQSRLENAIKNSGGNFDQLSPQIQSAYDKMAKFGFNATDTASALTTLTNMTHDPQRALSLLGDTANFSAQYNKDLAFSAQAVGLAAEGQVGRLARLDPALKGITGGTVAVQKAQDGLQKALDNQAAVQAKVNDGSIKGADKFFALADAGKKVTDAQAKLNDAQSAGSDILHKLSETDMNAAQKKSETFQGQVKALSAELENLGIKIGQALVPIIETLVGWLTDTVDFFERNQGAAIALGIVVGTVLTAAITAFAVNTAAKFVGAIKDMLTNLGILGTESEVVAGEVEASGATMEGALGAEGLAGAAGGADAALGEAGLAAGAGEAAGSMGLLLNPVTLVAGALLGGAYAAGYFNDGLLQTGITQGMVANDSSKQLSKAMDDLKSKIHDTAFEGAAYTSGATSMSAAQRDLAAKTQFTNQIQSDFNALLDKAPQDAQSFIDAAGKAGLATQGFKVQLQQHMDQMELNKLKTEEWNDKLGLLDAQTSGNADMVKHYQDQLFWLGVQEDQLHDKIINVDVDASQAFSTLDALQQRLQGSGYSFLTGNFAPGVTSPGAANAQAKPFGAEGAIVTAPTIALIGEAGPEALVPLNRMPGASPLPASVGGGGGDVYHINVAVPVGAHAADVGRQLVDALIAFQRRNGTHWQSVT